MKRPFKPLRAPLRKKNSSWENASQWYDEKMGEDGWYYHKQILIPRSLKILRLHKKSHYRLLDLGCGQGIFSRYLPDHGEYVGIDQSPSLLKKASGYASKHQTSEFIQGDITQELDLKPSSFTHALLLLSLQDCGNLPTVFKNAFKALEDQGTLLMVLNHPCFRIPKLSRWSIRREQNSQSRTLDAYLSPREVELRVNPSLKQRSPTTLWHHHSLSCYSKALRKEGFLIKEIYEWTSDKKSEGKYAKMENRAREEFPLFLAIEAIKFKN